MTLEIVLLTTSGFVALAMGALILTASPGRVVSVLAGGAMALLGLLQLGFARAMFAFEWGGRNTWLELSLVFSLPVSVVWVLLSATLSRTQHLGQLRGWRAYVLAQLLLCAGAVILMALSPLVGITPLGKTPTSVPLRPAGLAILAVVLINVVVLTANFESTYLALPRRTRHRLAPALGGVVLVAGYYAYLLGWSLWHRRASTSDLGLSGLPVTVATILFTTAMIRGRVAEITLPEPRRPLYRTASLLLPALTLAAVYGVLELTEITGWSLARVSFTIMTSGAALGIAALIVSNRVQRRVWGVLQPYLYRSRLRRGDVWTRLHRELEVAHTLEEWKAVVPGCVRELSSVRTVTVFLPDASGSSFVSAASTLDPPPAERVRLEDPLACELRRARKPLFLRGRPDDLEYIPIYVENGPQLRACDAASAVPLLADGELIGFLLCGRPVDPEETSLEKLPVLEFLAQGLAPRLEVLTLRERVAHAGAGPGTPLDTPRPRS
jgi:hypothetical protein